MKNVSFTEPNIQENEDNKFINWFVVSSIGTTLVRTAYCKYYLHCRNFNKWKINNILYILQIYNLILSVKMTLVLRCLSQKKTGLVLF